MKMFWIIVVINFQHFDFDNNELEHHFNDFKTIFEKFVQMSKFLSTKAIFGEGQERQHVRTKKFTR